MLRAINTQLCRICFLIMLSLLGCLQIVPAFAQTDKWKELVLLEQAPYQAKGITVKIFKEQYSGLVGQHYTVLFTNISKLKLVFIMFLH